MKRLWIVLIVFGFIGAGITWALSPLQTNPWVVRLFGPPRPTMVEAYASEGTATFDHSELDAVLGAVRGHAIDYTAIDTAALDRYLAAVATAPFDALSRDGKLALLINAYNAFTLKLILENGGASLGSIKDIPSAERWDAKRWRFAGRTVSLTELEHEELRAKFIEPRIHFAINCASIGCPPLRDEAFVPARLAAQLEEQAKGMHQDARWLRIDGDTVHLTPLYLWYQSDFEAVAGSVLAYASQWREVEGKTVVWQDYDWSLNQVR